MKLLLVDDHPVARAGLAAVLRVVDDECDVIEAGTAAEGLQIACDRSDIEIAFVDLVLPDMDGVAFLRALSQAQRDLPVIVVSASESPADARRALAAGAMGYLPKTASARTIFSAFRLVQEGSVYVPPLLLREHSHEPPPGHLTPRQFKVLTLLCDGLSNKDICKELGLSEKTVKAHLTAVFKALNVDGRVQAVVAARHSGLTRPSL